MPRRCSILSCLALVLMVLSPCTGTAEEYPTRPVRIITDSAPGSAIDVIIRIVADRLSHTFGQQVITLNQPGAGGSIAARAAAQSPPDGYTLFVASLSTFVAPPGAAANLPLQVPRDFMTVGYLGGAPMFISVASWLDVKTLPELIALAQKRPGELTYGSNGPGRLTHLTGELLAHRANIKLLMVPFSGGTAQVLNEVMGRRIDLAIDAYSGLAGGIEGGSVVPLAVASASRLPTFPNLPTAAETLPGFNAVGWQVVLAPVGTPEVIVKRINADLIQTLSNPDTRERLGRFHRDERLLSPVETAEFIVREQATWAPVLKHMAEGAK